MDGCRHRRALPLVLCLVLGAGCGGSPGASQQPPVPAGSQAALDAAVPHRLQEQGTAHPNAGQPKRIEIPALGLSARVVAIGLKDGRLVAPADPRVVGWWKGGAVPGAAKGSAMLTGHTVSTGGGAFDDLKNLRRGDRVSVRTVRGKIAYRVEAVLYYPKAELARLSDQLFSQAVPGRLVLSTCSDFDGRKYRGNTLVFATPVLDARAGR